MLHYFDIRLLPYPEVPAHELMAALYAKLHRALVQLASDNVAVSFPGYSLQRRTLGDTLRLIGPQGDMGLLMGGTWLQGLRDHCTLSTLRPIPADAGHRALRRVQAKSSPERLRRRQMRRHRLTKEQAAQRVPDDAAERLALPFVTLRSCSTGQQFNLYIRLQPSEMGLTDGGFSAFGLSATASVPWF